MIDNRHGGAARLLPLKVIIFHLVMRMSTNSTSTPEQRKNAAASLNAEITCTEVALESLSALNFLAQHIPSLAECYREGLASFCRHMEPFIKSLSSTSSSSCCSSQESSFSKRLDEIISNKLDSLNSALRLELANFTTSVQSSITERKASAISMEKTVKKLDSESIPSLDKSVCKIKHLIESEVHQQSRTLDEFRIDVSNRFALLGQNKVIISHTDDSVTVEKNEAPSSFSNALKRQKGRLPNGNLSAPRPPPPPKFVARPSFKDITEGNFSPPPIQLGDSVLHPEKVCPTVLLFPKNGSNLEEVWSQALKSSKGAGIQIIGREMLKSSIKISVVKPQQATSLVSLLKNHAGVSCREVKLRRPEISILSVSNDVLDEDIPDEVFAQNDFISRSSRWNQMTFRQQFEVVKAYQSNRDIKNNNKTIIVRCSPAVRNSIMFHGSVFIGSLACRCVDKLDPLRCFRCNRYGHGSRFCDNDPLCPSCLGSHSPSKDSACPRLSSENSIPKCAACFAKERGDYIGHSLTSSSCVSKLRAMEHLVRSTDYGWFDSPPMSSDNPPLDPPPSRPFQSPTPAATQEAPQTSPVIQTLNSNSLKESETLSANKAF